MRSQGLTTKDRGSEERGFTLMELLVVIALLGILMVAGLGSFTSSLQKSRDSRRKGDLRQISLALETYYNDVGRYPLSSGGAIDGCGAGAALACTWGVKWSNTTTNMVYMILLGSDPLVTKNYYYVSDATGTYFKLYAFLENTKDTDKGTNQGGYAATDCGGGTACTYGIASSNQTP